MTQWLDAISDSVANGFLLPEDAGELEDAAEAWAFPD
jgi:hypothetical protein